MKHQINIALLFLVFLAVPAIAHAAGFESMIPKPLHLDRGAGKQTLVSGLRVHIPKESPERVREIAEVFAEELKEHTSLACALASSDAIEPGAVTFILQTPVVPEACAPESYSLEINANGIVIAAASTQGLFWGAQTFLQGIENENGQYFVSHASINDQPARAWRGLMLDPSRSFLELDFIRRTIRVMSSYKMNILHLHLIDDESWAYESKVFPKCNRPGDRYYTQDELRELVRYAARYGVEVLPEVDFPGHAAAHVTAYPQLDCEGKPRVKREAILCAGKAFSWDFMDKVIAEMASIFPSRYIHLGTDEPFAIKRWQDCPDCKARMKAKGVTTLESFYHTFVTDLNDLVKRHGRQLIVWNDAIRAGIAPMPPKDIIIHAWREGKPRKSNNPHVLAADGYTIINSSFLPLYLTSSGLAQGVTLPAVKDWDAMLFGTGVGRAKPGMTKVTYKEFPARALILGGIACLWSSEQGIVEKRMYPRALCVAETLWAEGRAGDLADFEARWPAHEARLGRLGVSPEYKRPAAPLFENTTPVPTPLRSAEKYQDFILTFELDTTTSVPFTGITVRDDYKVSVVAPPESGHVLKQAMSDLKGWHTYELTARGSIISLTIDGYLVWSLSNAVANSGRITVAPAAGVKGHRNFAIRKLD